MAPIDRPQGEQQDQDQAWRTGAERVRKCQRQRDGDMAEKQPDQDQGQDDQDQE